jgi:hypothetical protein
MIEFFINPLTACVLGMLGLADTAIFRTSRIFLTPGRLSETVYPMSEVLTAAFPSPHSSNLQIADGGPQTIDSN